MEAYQRQHLLSSYLAALELIEEMETIACEGRASATPGAHLAPLPNEWWKRIAAPLHDIRRLLREMAESEAPAELREHEAAQPLAATVRWLSILLLRLEEEVQSLDPGRLQRRYGTLPNDTVQRLEKLGQSLEEALKRARSALDHPPER